MVEGIMELSPIFNSEVDFNCLFVHLTENDAMASTNLIPSLLCFLVVASTKRYATLSVICTQKTYGRSTSQRISQQVQAGSIQMVSERVVAGQFNQFFIILNFNYFFIWNYGIGCCYLLL